MNVISQENFSLFLSKLLVVVLVTLAAFLFWQAGEIFLLVFAGILLAVFLQTFASMISKTFRIKYPQALVLFIASLGLSFFALTRLFAPTLNDQAALLAIEIPKAFKLLLTEVVDSLPFSVDALKTSISNFDVLHQVTTIFSTTIGAITGIIVFLFVGIYLAFDYPLYVNGLLKLFPHGKRAVAERVLLSCGETLRWWLVGQLIAMTILGSATFIGLYILEIPLAFILALLAGMLTFLPTLGPILAALPAILIALTLGPLSLAYVILLYTGVQLSESYFITPYIQKRTTALPPALVVVVQVLMGVLAGILGIALAAPLTAVGLVLIDQIYIKEIIDLSSRDEIAAK